MIPAPMASRSRGSSVLTVAAVPTGMKAGVSIAPRAVWSRPRLAGPSSERSSNRITAPLSPADGEAVNPSGHAAPPRRRREPGSAGSGRARARPGDLRDDATPDPRRAPLHDEPQADAPLDP